MRRHCGVCNCALLVPCFAEHPRRCLQPAVAEGPAFVWEGWEPIDPISFKQKAQDHLQTERLKDLLDHGATFMMLHHVLVYHLILYSMMFYSIISYYVMLLDTLRSQS